MERLKQLAKLTESKLYAFLDAQLPVLHTAWQAALSALVVSLLAVKSSGDVKAALIAAGAIFLAGLKAAYLNRRG